MEKAYAVWRAFQDQVLARAAALLLIGCTLLALVEVVRRYVFGFSFEWQQDAVTFFILSGVFLYFSISQRHNEHLNVIVLLEVLQAGGPRGRQAAELIKLVALVLSFLFMLAVVWWGVPEVEDGTIDAQVINNTVTRVRTGLSASNWQDAVTPTVDGIVQNNLFRAERAMFVNPAVTAGLTNDYNLFDGATINVTPGPNTIAGPAGLVSEFEPRAAAGSPAIDAGDMELTAQLLGRRFRLSGVVERGFARGRELGYPTANLMVVGELIVPASGIYAAYVHIDEPDAPAHAGLVYIGTSPTFEPRDRTV